MAREAEARTTSAPPPPPQAAQGNGSSVIAPDLKVTGNLACKGALQVNGEIEGDVSCDIITVGEQGQIKGNITAKTARISGTVQGQVEAAEVLIAKTARMMGDVLHQSLTVEQGAFLEGHCARIKSAADKPKMAVASSTGPAPGGAASA